MQEFKYKSVLITGGTGSLGVALLKTFLSFPEIERLVIFSRDEMKQWELKKSLSAEEKKKVRFFLGDIRDLARLKLAFRGIDLVIHAAALKIVETCEYNPFDAIKTNVFGTMNIIEAAIETNVRKVIGLSTDKACSPSNLYGATKLCADKQFQAAKNYSGMDGPVFAVVRYGNVIGSRGSVIRHLFDLREKGGDSPIFELTDPRMTRFLLPLSQGIDLILQAVSNAIGGEVFIRRCVSCRILELAELIVPGIEIKVVGKRPGEKLAEQLVGQSDDKDKFVEMGDTLIEIPYGMSPDEYIKRSKNVRLERSPSLRGLNSADPSCMLSKTKLRDWLGIVFENYELQSFD